MVSLKDIAKTTGYSLSTVSIVLRGVGRERGIPTSTQEIILNTAKSMGYQPNISARRLRSELPLKRSIAVFWADDYRAIMVAKFLQGVQQYINNCGADFEVIIRPYQPDKLFDTATPAGLNMYAGSVICNASQDDLTYIEEIETLCPIVIYNRNSDKYPCVGVDNEQVGAVAARKLMDDGCQNMVVVTDHSNLSHSNARITGFYDACRIGGKIAQTKMTPSNSIADGKTCAANLLTAPEKTGIFVTSDQLAMGLLTGLVDRGVNIPTDVEIISPGTSDIDIYRCLRPSLTIIEIPLEKMAYDCTSMLHNIIERRELTNTAVTVPFQIYEGTSTKTKSFDS